MRMQFDEEEKAEMIFAVFYIIVTDGWVKAKCIKLPQEGIEGRESQKWVDVFWSVFISLTK